MLGYFFFILIYFTPHVFSSVFDADCSDDENLVLNIPYPPEVHNEILNFSAGSCTSNWEEVKQNGGSKIYDQQNQRLVVTFPIEFCNLKTDLYDEPVPSRMGIYRNKLKLEFGTTESLKKNIFKNDVNKF